MKVLVCGGRKYSDKDRVFRELDILKAHYSDLTVIEGGAAGADYYAREWARYSLLPRITVPANWRQHGKRAGPIRNAEMLTFKPDLVLAFPGGNGTKNMVEQARAAGVEVKEIT